MGKIVIIGAGAMGTAFAYPCCDNKHEVNIVGTHLENKAVVMIREKAVQTVLWTTSSIGPAKAVDLKYKTPNTPHQIDPAAPKKIPVKIDFFFIKISIDKILN